MSWFERNVGALAAGGFLCFIVFIAIGLPPDPPAEPVSLPCPGAVDVSKLPLGASCRPPAAAHMESWGGDSWLVCQCVTP